MQQKLRPIAATVRDLLAQNRDDQAVQRLCDALRRRRINAEEFRFLLNEFIKRGKTVEY